MFMGEKLGKDASDDFDDEGHSDDAREMLAKFYIGDLVRVVKQ
jgi:cytochrome b involved in lipid metabolism